MSHDVHKNYVYHLSLTLFLIQNKHRQKDKPTWLLIGELTSTMKMDPDSRIGIMWRSDFRMEWTLIFFCIL